MTTTEYSGGPLRPRRQAKVQADTGTQHRLWLVRLQDLVAAGDTPRDALDKLAGETRGWLAEIPQRKAERLAAWHAFLRKIPTPPTR